MSWLYSRALVEAYSAASSSVGAPSAPSSTSPMPQAYLPPDRMTAFSRLSRYGMTFEPLTDDLGAAVLTSFLAAFPVKTSAPLDAARELPASAADCGWKWRESSVRYDPDSRLWRTRQCSLLGDSEWFSETWPRWGLMRDGESWELPMSERPTFARGYGSPQRIATPTAAANQLAPSMRRHPSCAAMWPTPVAHDDGKTPKAHMRMKANMKGGPRHKPTSLTVMVKGVEQGLFPTPTTRDHKGGADWSTRQRNGNPRPASDMTLPDVIEKFPTPRSEDSQCAGGHRGADDTLYGAICKPKNGPAAPGSLNPTWVEWLMGWPLGWTDLKPLATARCHSAPPRHGES